MQKVIIKDGPRAGDELAFYDPPRWLKLAMPEWAVYERVDGEYHVRFEGRAARAWRNPDRPAFVG